MTDSCFSSETPKGQEQRFNKDKVTSYKLPEGLDVQTEKKPNTQEQQPKKKINKYEIKIYILTHSKWRNNYDDIYFSELKSCISVFFTLVWQTWWHICTGAFQQLLARGWNEEGRVNQEKYEPMWWGGMIASDNPADRELWKDGEMVREWRLRGSGGGRVLTRVTLALRVPLWQD